MPRRPILRAAALAASILLAPTVQGGPALPCPDGPDPLRFEPERSVVGGACRPAAEPGCAAPEPSCPGPVAIAATVDEGNGAELVALAWYSPTRELWVAVSGDGGRSFSSASRGMAPVLVSTGPCRGRPSLALRSDGGALWLGVAYEVGGETRVRLTDALDGSFGGEAVFDGAPADLAPSLAVSPAPLPPAFALGTADGATGEALFATTVAQRDPGGWSASALGFGPGVRLALAADAAGLGAGFGLTCLGLDGGGRLRVLRSDDGGETWGPERFIGPGASGSFAPAIAAAPDSSLADSAWSLLAHGFDEAGVVSVRADAARQAGGVLDHAFDQEEGTGSTELEGAAEILVRPAVAASPDGLAHVLWADGGELRLARRGLTASRPTLAGGCGPLRLTGLFPPRPSGTAAAPVAAALGPDLVVAFVDDRDGEPAVWIKRSDSRPPALPVLMPTPSTCGQVPAVALTWGPPEPDVVSQVLEVGTAPGGTDLTRDVSLSSTSVVEGLLPGTTYWFRLRVRDAAGHEVVSEEVSADLPSCADTLLRSSLALVTDSCPFGGAGGDGVLDPGETAFLRVQVENLGPSDAPDVQLRLFSRTPELFVRTGNLILGDLPAGELAEGQVAVDLSATLGCGERTEALARLSSDGTQWGDLLDLGTDLACTPCFSAACSVASDASASAPQAICRGESATLDATASSAADCAGQMLHEWWSGESLVGTGSTRSVSPTGTTSYRLVSRCSTDLSCEGESSVEILVRPLPPLSLEQDPPPPHCEGETVTLRASTSDPAATFRWDGGEVGAELSVSVGGLYGLTVTDSEGCSSARTWRIDFAPMPLADAGPDPPPTTCAPVRLGTAPFPLLDYAWQPEEGLDDPRSPRPLADPAGPTIYTLTVSDPLSGCIATDEVLVDVAPAPPRVEGLRLARSGTQIEATWSLPSDRPVRLYAEESVALARSASASSPSALRLCEGLDACLAPTPASALVFLQAVAACEDGLSEGPN